MKTLSYDSLNAEERQYFDEQFEKFINSNTDEWSYKGCVQVDRIYRDAITNNRLASVILLLEIYKLEKPDNYFTETGYELHRSIIIIADKADNEMKQDIFTWMVDYLFQQTPDMIGDVVSISRTSEKNLTERLLDRFFQGLESSDDKIRKKAQRAKEICPMTYDR